MDLSLKSVLFHQPLSPDIPDSFDHSYLNSNMIHIQDKVVEINADHSDLNNGIYLLDSDNNLYEYSLYQRKILTMKNINTKKESKNLSS